MIGRGTRLCPDLFGPGQDKEFFRVFDYCQNLEFFGANPEVKEPSATKSLSERLFAARLDLVQALDQTAVTPSGFGESEQAPFGAEDGQGNLPSEETIRADALGVLRKIVAGMTLDNFIVRPHRRLVEIYQATEAWTALDEAKCDELKAEIAPLPSAVRLGTEEAKRFDLLLFSLELSLLKGSKRFDALRKQLLEIVSALEEQTGIPAIARQAVLIEEIQTDTWWEGVTVPLLDLVRLRLRDLVQHIEKGRKAVVYSDFVDEIGEGVERPLPQVGEADFARFRQKARHFLKAHEDNIVLHRLRQGKPLTPIDLAALEAMLLDAGIGEASDIARARETSRGFGGFVRSLVGLDKTAVSAAFGDLLAPGSATASQIEFIGMIIEHLTDQGVMDPSMLYEPPFTEIAPTGPDQVFDEQRVTRLFATIRSLSEAAAA